jgi:hypothetical protein
MCATVRPRWPTVWPTTSRCRPTAVSAVGEQRVYAAPRRGLPLSYLSTVEKCSGVISLAMSEMTSLEVGSGA